MMSFRFHLVSLTAVFLAFALGILIGSTVVDKATVDVLESQIRGVLSDKRAADARANELRGETRTWDRFASESEALLLQGRLAGVRVLVVSTEGADAGAVDKIREDLARAGAIDAGSVVLDTDWNDDDATARANVSVALGVGAELPRMTALRETSATRLATEWAAGGGATTAALSQAGYLRVTAAAPLTEIPGPDARFVVVGGRPANGLAIPLARALAEAAPARLVVTEIAAEDDDADPIGSLVGPLRKARGEARLSTVDHAEEFRGRVAIVLALGALARGETGDYGTAPGADRTVPAGA